MGRTFPTSVTAPVLLGTFIRSPGKVRPFPSRSTDFKHCSCKNRAIATAEDTYRTNMVLAGIEAGEDWTPACPYAAPREFRSSDGPGTPYATRSTLPTHWWVDLGVLDPRHRMACGAQQSAISIGPQRLTRRKCGQIAVSCWFAICPQSRGRESARRRTPPGWSRPCRPCAPAPSGRSSTDWCAR